MSQFLDCKGPQQDSIAGSLAAPDFSLRLSMDCGQVFGWEWDGEWCAGVISGAAVALRQEGPRVHYVAGPGVRPEQIESYLGLEENYGRIIRSISVDDFMKRAVESARGLRILKQDAWPCLGSYILSSNNRVERIQSLVQRISRTMGDAHSVRDKLVYSFPEPTVLGACPEGEIRSCGAGFRSPYLNEASRMIAAGARQDEPELGALVQD